jgi:iron complex transport system substrate-binding protein
LHVDVKNSFNGSILADVGFLRPSAQDVVVEGGLKFISEEMIPEVDADVIFIPTDARDRESNRRLDYIKQSPLWQRLEAVRQNRVYLVDYHTWRSANPFAADGVIDDLFKYLVSSSIDTTK